MLEGRRRRPEGRRRRPEKRRRMRPGGRRWLWSESPMRAKALMMSELVGHPPRMVQGLSLLLLAFVV
jgi:hypothetical protein